MSTPARSNRLIHETSPYLQQHAHNPVDWYPWGEAALARARAEDKPILLSIGYSACHWCHVMEHESFEDAEVARVMNELYVCIKVDREERPDLDRIYQIAYQMLSGRAGGWPLNMILMPDDHTPFFGGTYFPKTARHGLPPFIETLTRVADYYRARRHELDAQNAAVREAFARMESTDESTPAAIGADALAAARRELEGQFDKVHGGFGGAPKFPHPTSIEFCLRYWARTADHGAREIAHHSLRAMAQGGINDQLGGGFYRYSVDARWMIPHFEKMLYDNAQLLALYADAALATGDSLFARTAANTANWVQREMQAEAGGYYSSLDADSEGHEGRFYVWTTAEIRPLLSPAEWDVVAARYGLNGTPNFEGEWHLHVHADTAALADRLQCPEDGIASLLDAAHAKLLSVRARRVRPGRDEKILTSWNGLMIKGMARAGRRLARPDFIASAERALDFVRATLWHDERLNATTKDGKVHLNAYLDDYVFLMDGILELLQARWRDGDLDFLIQLAEAVLAHFEDQTNGGFYFTADDHERLIHRFKPGADDALPSGNGVAAYVLQRLGHLLGETRYLDAAERTLQALAPAIARYPSGHGALLLALEEYIHPTETVVLRGAAVDLAPWLARADTGYAPRRLTLAIPSAAGDLPGVLAERTPRADVTAYICTGHACTAPVTDFTAFAQALGPEPATPERI